MRHRFSIGFARKFAAVFAQSFAELSEILDDAVVHDGHQIRRMRMGVVLGRPPMRRPARVANTDRAAEWLAIETILKRAQLAFGTSATERAFLKRGDTGRVVAAILETLECVDQLARNRLVPKNSDDPRPPSGRPLCPLTV